MDQTYMKERPVTGLILKMSLPMLISMLVNSLYNIVDSFFVYRGHKDGPEIHSITDTGIIVIHNQKSGKMVTKLIARPGQIARYYLAEGRTAPQSIIDIAREHQKKGYNHV